MPTVRFSISLDAVKDARLMRWLDEQTNASEAIRKALYAYIDRPSHGDLSARLEQLLEMVQRMRVVEAPAEDTDEALTEDGEPAAARRGLDAMKRKFREANR